MIKLARILVPTDFSESARHALTYGVSFAREYRAELVLVHVLEMLPLGYATDLFPVPMAEVFQELSAHARKELAVLHDEIATRTERVRVLLRQGRPAPEIIAAAREETIDMIVLGAHGRGMLDKALFGSTTERVVRGAPCPVLTCRLAEHEFVEPDPSS